MSEIPKELHEALADRYALESVLGRGGMATVYLADDLRHDRRVAVKVLQPELAAAVGAERFLAEIRTTAKLRHPNILPLFDSGDAAGSLFFVTPYVDGETLRDRLADQGQLPVPEALRIARGILRGLEHAHKQGVVHRDIKPANILLQDGEALVADFGIAFAVGAEARRLTQTGLTVGTPQYMSPEQATAEDRVGPTTDLWSTGCVLYEALTGEPPFDAKTSQGVVGKVLTQDPVPATERRKAVPPHVAYALTRSLEKLPADRFQTAGEFAAALTAGEAVRVLPASGEPRPWRLLAGVGAAGLLLGALLTSALLSNSSGDRSRGVVRFRIPAALQNAQTRATAITPQGHVVAEGGNRKPLLIRRLDRMDEPATVASAGFHPFFSPDGEWVAYFDAAGLRKMPVGGGSAVDLAPLVDRTLGGTWMGDRIVFANTGGLYLLSEDGGTPVVLAEPNADQDELHYAWPHFLPGGRIVLFTIVSTEASSDSEGVIAALDLESGEVTPILRGGSTPRYVEGERLLFSTGGRLQAVSFDPSSLQTGDAPVEALPDPVMVVRSYGADFDVAANGTLIYAPPYVQPERTLAWVTPEGSLEDLGAPARHYVYPRLSPDGLRLVVDLSPPNRQRDLYVWDSALGSLNRLTDEPGEELFGVWSRDGRTVYYSANVDGPFGVWARAADGSGESRLVYQGDRPTFLMGMTPDGDRLVATTVRENSGGFDIMSVSVTDPSDVQIHLATEYNETSPSVSPDGQWLAYSSNSTGQPQVYIGRFPDASGSRWQVSVDGGQHPVWGATGDHLFWRDPTGDIIRTEVAFDPEPSVGAAGVAAPHTDQLFAAEGTERRHAVSPRDGRILLSRPLAQQEEGGVVMVLNWFEELNRLIPPS